MEYSPMVEEIELIVLEAQAIADNVMDEKFED